MDTKTTLSITDARKQIFQIANQVQVPGVHYTLTENGRPKAVLISAEYYESLLETIEVMQDFPDLAKDIEEADKDYTSGKYNSYTTFEELLAKEGFVLADKPKTRDETYHKNKTKRRKRARQDT